MDNNKTMENVSEKSKVVKIQYEKEFQNKLKKKKMKQKQLQGNILQS